MNGKANEINVEDFIDGIIDLVKKDKEIIRVYSESELRSILQSNLKKIEIVKEVEGQKNVEGKYNSSDKKIVLLKTNDKKDFMQRAIHESVHALIQKNVYYCQKKFSSIKFAKQQVRFNNSKKGLNQLGTRLKIFWNNFSKDTYIGSAINEGYTEWLAGKISGRKSTDVNAYNLPEKMFEILEVINGKEEILKLGKKQDNKSMIQQFGMDKEQYLKFLNCMDLYEINRHKINNSDMESNERKKEAVFLIGEKCLQDFVNGAIVKAFDKQQKVNVDQFEKLIKVDMLCNAMRNEIKENSEIRRRVTMPKEYFDMKKRILKEFSKSCMGEIEKMSPEQACRIRMYIEHQNLQGENKSSDILRMKAKLEKYTEKYYKKYSRRLNSEYKKVTAPEAEKRSIAGAKTMENAGELDLRELKSMIDNVRNKLSKNMQSRGKGTRHNRRKTYERPKTHFDRDER